LSSNGFNGYHTKTINGKGEPTLSDIIAVATGVGLPQQRATQIIEKVSQKCAEQKHLLRPDFLQTYIKNSVLQLGCLSQHEVSEPRPLFHLFLWNWLLKNFTVI